MVSRGRWSRAAKGRTSSTRAVSDVVGTILLLALTVTLFASIFFFVDTFPTPPPASANQFQAALGYTGGSSITSVNIAHLAGPTLSGPNVLIYLYSSSHPTRFPSPYHISNGRNGSNTWALGQNWFLNITNKTLTVPDNITVSIATQTQLLFRVTLPGSNPELPPTFVNSGTAPATLGIGQGFQIFVQIVDPDLKANSVYVNVSQIPGASGTFKMTYSAVTSLWTYNVANGVTTAAGTFYVFVNATDQIGQVGSIAIPVVITTAQVTQANIQLTVQPSLPVKGVAATLFALVTNPGASASGVTVTFKVGGATVGSSSGSVGGGASASFSTSWTPLATGPTTVSALANLTVGGSVSGTLNLTVFPSILFIAHNVVAGQKTAFNESAYLAQSLVADGIPFTTMFVSCTAGLPTSVAMNAYGVVIIDFGSNPAAGCSAVTAAEQGKITGSSANFWLVGEWAFHPTTCSSYTAAFLGLAGVGWAGAGTCTALQTAASSAITWTPTPASGMRSDGIPTMAINKTLAGSSAFEPYADFSRGATHTFFSTAAGSVGAWNTAGGGQRAVAMATDPALIAQTLPNGNTWIDNAAGSSIAYNVMNYLCGFASAASPGRGLADHGVGGIMVWGVSHSAPSTIYAELRQNGPVGELVTVTLYVNGSAALYGGVIVTASIALGANGGIATATLIWQAPSGGPYTLSVLVTPSDLNSRNDQLPASITNSPVKFG